MKRHEDGLMTPDVLSGPSAYLIRAESILGQAERAKRFDSVVQAGGHIGIVPMILSGVFTRVYTFEPEIENYDCLAINVMESASDNIEHRWGFLGQGNTPMRLAKHAKSSGGHQVSLEKDARTGGQLKYMVPCFRIDDLRLLKLDAIFLDVEGYETFVLKGAAESIKKFRPLIVAEENKKALGFGAKIGDIEKFLRPLGYHKTASEGEDIVLEYAS